MMGSKLPVNQESLSADFVMQLYVIYGLLYFLVLVLDYFLWKSKSRFIAAFRSRRWIVRGVT